jgi:4-amino-4-deoxy-L-arabinose transferase-like glycosyltransferase
LSSEERAQDGYGIERTAQGSNEFLSGLAGRIRALCASLHWSLPLVTLAIAVAALYLYKLDAVGVLGPDEPRYAAIGRAMAHTGDLVTPRLWGSPWFEKPPLLYWLTALGTVAGLNPELSARLPVALLSLGFLAVSFFMLRSEFGAQAAGVATALLATSAGWITYSQLCLTDLPLAVCFSLAVFFALPLLRSGVQSGQLRLRLVAIGASLGLATLAKGLVPIALALPFFWFLRRYWRKWWLAFVAFAVVALPWYSAVYLRNGYPFVQDFFWKHHFERLYSASLQHVQPWYYYIPVLLAGTFPWTPLLGLLALRSAKWGAKWDDRRTFLAVICIFGLLFFSVSLNKLPGYLLPLLPSVFVLIGAQFEFRMPGLLSRWWLVPCSVFIGLIPLLVQALPQSLAAGRLSAGGIRAISRTESFYVAVPLVVVFLARRSWAGLLLVLCVASGGIYLKTRVYPVLDREVSARQFWQRVKPISEEVCEDWANRDFVYGLSFYRGSLIPPCAERELPYRLLSHGHGPPSIERNK